MKLICAALLLFLANPIFAQHFVWTTSGTQSANAGYQRFSDVDPDGNVYVMGSCVDFLNLGSLSATAAYPGESDIFLAKLNANGQPQWLHIMGGEWYDFPGEIKYDGNGFLYISYETQNTPLLIDGGSESIWGHLVTKWDTAGNYIWTKEIDGTNETGLEANANGFYTYDNGSPNRWILHYDTAGVLVWNISVTGWAAPGVNEMALNASGDKLLITGEYYDPAVNTSFGGIYLPTSSSETRTFTLQISDADLPTASVDWVDAIGDESEAYGVGFDADENVYIAGEYDDDFPFAGATLDDGGIGAGENGFLAKYDPSGNEIWAVKMQRLTTSAAFDLYDLAVNSLDEVVVCGGFSYDVDFGGISSFGSTYREGWLAYFDTAGVLTDFASSDGGTGTHHINSLSFDAMDNLYASGMNFSGDAAFSCGQSADSMGWFVTKYIQADLIFDASLMGDSIYSCGGESILMTATSEGADSVRWFKDGMAIPGATSETYTATDFGAYTMVAYKGKACVIETEAVVILALPLPDAPLVSWDGTDLIATAPDAVTYQWYLDGSSIAGAIDSVYTPWQNGTYTCEITDANGCGVASAGYTLDDVATGIAEMAAAGIRIGPNPSASGFFQLTLAGTAEAVIFSTSGKLIWSAQVTSQHVIDLSDNPSGLYLLRLNIDGQQWNTLLSR